MKKIIGFLLQFIIAGSLVAQEQKSLNKVAGLELPEPLQILPNSKNVTVQAKSEGQVKWLVIANKSIKYEEDVTKKTIIFKNFENIDSVNIFAVSNINGKLSDFANTKIIVKSAKDNDLTNNKKFTVTMFVNYQKLTPEQNNIINLPYTDTSGKYSDIQFTTLDIANLSDEKAKTFPNGFMIAKNKNKMDVYFGTMPQDVNVFKNILDSILNKGN